MAIKPSHSDLLSYRHWFACFEQLNKICWSDTSEHCEQVAIDDGKLTNHSSEQKDLILSPCSFELRGVMIKPIWIRAIVQENGGLLPHPSFISPFVPNSYCDPRSPLGLVLNKKELVDMFVKQKFGDINELKSLNWQQYLARIYELFELINPSLFLMNQSSFQLQRFVSEPSSVEPKGLAKQLIKIPSFDDAISTGSTHPLEVDDFIASPDIGKITSNFLEVALKVLQLPEGSVQTVEAPLASAIDSWLHTVVLSLAARHIGKLSALDIAVVGSSELVSELNQKQWLAKINLLFGKAFKKEEDAIEFLQARWQKEYDFQCKATKAFQLTFDAAQNQHTIKHKQLVDWQKEDEQLELQLEAFTESLELWRVKSQKSWLSKILRLFTGETKDRLKAEFLASRNISLNWDETKTLEDNLILKIRSLKVQRTKIHQQLMQLSSDLADMGSMLAIQKRCLERFPQLKHLNGIEATREILTSHGEFATQCLKALLQSSSTNVKIQWLTLDQAEQWTEPKESFDWLFIAHGNTVSPISMQNILGASERVVILGDSKCQTTASVSVDVDCALAQHYQLVECEEELDDLQLYGQLLSQSSLYMIAKPHDFYQSFDPTGILPIEALQLRDSYAPLPFVSYFTDHLKIKQNFHTHAGLLQFIEVEEDFSAEFGWQNPSEVNALVEYYQACDHDCVILTLSLTQKVLIEKALAAKGLVAEVMLLDACHRRTHTILFSPVYSSKAPRPHYLDCGDSPLYQLMSLAANQLIFFGDPLLLNVKSHSPMGGLSKCMANPLMSNQLEEA